MSRLFELHRNGICVLVVGDVMLDRYLLGRCERISPEAPVQVVDVSESRCALGGAGNVLRNVQGMNGAASLASVIGDDDVGKHVVRLLAEGSSGPVKVAIESGRRTSEKTRLLAAHQQVVRYDIETRSSIDARTEAEVVDFVHAHAGFHAVVLSDYDKGVLTPSLCQKVIARARALGVPVLCDPKGRDFGKYLGATIITPNRKEAAEASRIAITDRASLIEAGRTLREQLRVAYCLITLGEEGMALFSEDGFHHLPARAREVFDVTGAGDTVIAVLAVCLALGLPVLEACDLANVAAGLTVAKLGAAPISLAELRDALKPTTRPGLNTKIKRLEALIDELGPRRAKGARIVFTNGCFDVLHRGHVEYLENAARMGDVLVLGLNSDESVRRLKGPSRPIQPQDDRAAIAAALASVDYVVVFDEDTPYELIRQLQPDILVKGGDYQVDNIVGADIVRARGGEVRVVPFLPGRSTSALLERSNR